MINPWLLGFSQFLLMVYVSVGLAYGGIVGAEMVSIKFATLPFLFATATTMMVALFLEKLTKRLGYQTLFILGAMFGVISGMVSGWAIMENSFFLFCLGAMLAGGFQGSSLYYRFAASDSVSMNKKSSAIAWVLSGGVLAAILGPVFASNTVNLLEAIPYAGAFYSSSIVAALILPVLLFLRPVLNASVIHENEPSSPYLLSDLFKTPCALRAMLLCVGGYAVMAFIMVASPLAVKGCGFHLDDAASVIQWHLIGMFAPSLVAGKLIQRWGVTWIANVGLALLFIAAIAAFSSEQLHVFHIALFLVGLGWNFMFMSGSTLIAQVEDLPMRYKLQATNEALTYGVMAVSTGVSGVIYQYGGWQLVSIVACIMLLVISAGLIYIAFMERKVSMEKI